MEDYYAECRKPPGLRGFHVTIPALQYSLSGHIPSWHFVNLQAFRLDSSEVIKEPRVWYRAIVSHSMPEKPKAESPSTATTSRPGAAAEAATAPPKPMPMVPHVAASNLVRGSSIGPSITLHAVARD